VKEKKNEKKSHGCQIQILPSGNLLKSVYKKARIAKEGKETRKRPHHHHFRLFVTVCK